ncbi:hypothetical protein SAMN05192565_112111 [Methylobacterium gossipiicola]|jgi:hypothetical protein|uniref:Uncharacterized protein n=1 Tax=Methylobacterium gossipiicola TaxID=582675 RepID=A0A1I2V026_9HYPH|nr:hypothetical protein SAMN05192565_112111 [Methylobacterium gossipiicola]
MTTLWHKDRLWPSETSPITGGPLPGAIPPGIYAESVKDWERLRAKSFPPGSTPSARSASRRSPASPRPPS